MTSGLYISLGYGPWLIHSVEPVFAVINTTLQYLGLQPS
jgi:hypothetical protein